jgi:hypothetical protein
MNPADTFRDQVDHLCITSFIKIIVKPHASDASNGAQDFSPIEIITPISTRDESVDLA